MLSIGQLAERTGVSVETLRAWERRYGVLRPVRSRGGHRRYSALMSSGSCGSSTA